MAETDSRILEYLEEGLFLYGVGKVQESIARWKKVLELDPKNERALDYIESAGGDVSAYRKAAATGAPPPQPPPSTPPMKPVTPQAATPRPPAPPAPAPPRPSPPAAPPMAPVAPSDPFAQFGSAPAAPSGWQAMPPVAPPQPPQPPTPPAPQVMPWNAPQAAPPPPKGDSRDELLSKAAALYRAKYYEASLELLERIAREFPPVDETLRGYLEASRTAYFDTLKATWSRTDLVPKPRMGSQQVMQLKLSNEAGFILSRIDGMATVEDLLSMCGLDQFTALRALNALLQQGAIELAR